MEIFVLVLQIVILLGLVTFSFFLKSYFPKYLEEKGKNLATKEDIEDITRKVESIKADFDERNLIFQTKYQLKYEACLGALALIDAHFSHKLLPPKDGEIAKQFATTEQARICHNKLILSCENTEILKKFDEIMFVPQSVAQISPTDLLNEFRNLIRKELGYGSNLDLNRDRAWFGKVGFEPKNE